MDVALLSVRLPAPRGPLAQDRRCLREAGRAFGQDGWTCALPWRDPESPAHSPASRPSRGACRGPLSVVHICQTSDAPDAGRASASWGPWLGAPLTRLPGSAPALRLLQTQGRLLHHSLGPLGNCVCAQTLTPHTDGARGPGHGTRRSEGCPRKLGVSCGARSSGRWLGSRLTSPARCRRRRGALHLEELCLQSLTRRRGHGRGCPDRRACPRPVPAETACYRLGA